MGLNPTDVYGIIIFIPEGLANVLELQVRHSHNKNVKKTFSVQIPLVFLSFSGLDLIPSWFDLVPSWLDLVPHSGGARMGAMAMIPNPRPSVYAVGCFG